MFKKSDTPLCPFLNKPCLKHGCVMWTHVAGMNPQTGQPMDHWDCTFKIMPLLMVDQVRHLNGVQAATESNRNETVKTGHNIMTAVMLAQQGGRFINDADAIESGTPTQQIEDKT